MLKTNKQTFREMSTRVGFRCSETWTPPPSFLLHAVTRQSQETSCHHRGFLCELTALPVDLVLGDDDLAGVDIVGVLDGVTHDTDGPDHLAHLVGAVHHVAGVTDQLLAARNLWRGEKGERVRVRVTN